MASYASGSQIRLSAAFTVSGVATDPTTVSLTVKDPTGTETIYTYAAAQIVKDSTGNYHYDLTASTTGAYYYGFSASGTVVAASQGHFTVVSDL